MKKKMTLEDISKTDILGLIPEAMYRRLHDFGYYMIIPMDAFPFCMRVIHKKGFEVVLESATEEGLIKEAEEALKVFNDNIGDVLINKG